MQKNVKALPPGRCQGSGQAFKALLLHGGQDLRGRNRAALTEYIGRFLLGTHLLDGRLQIVKIRTQPKHIQRVRIGQNAV